MESNMRNLPEDAALGEQPTVVKGKLYAATKGQQDQLAEFAATLGAPVPEEHRKENKGHVAPAAPVEVEAVVARPVESEPVATVDVVIKVDGEEIATSADVSGLEKVGTMTLPIDGEDLGHGARPVSGGAVDYATGASSTFDMNVPSGTAADIKQALRKVQESESFTGFEVPDGDYMAMLMLHPERLADGTRGEVPQIQIGTTKEAWKSWVKDAVVHGLTQGWVHADDGETKLTGMSVQVHAPDGQTKRLGFMFTQIAAIIPFREVDELMLRRERAVAERKAKAAKEKKAKTKARKQQSQSRKKNR